ncbi:MAG: BON domain-containing protein [Verrucomicrobiia bacterium]
MTVTHRDAQSVLCSSQRLALALLLAILVVGCGRNDSGGAGAGSPAFETGEDSARQTGVSSAAPDAQPQYGPGGTSPTSRIAPVAAPGLQPPDAASQAGLSDAELARKVHVALSTGTSGTTGVYTPDLLMDEITVSASNGVVSLAGPVGSQKARQWLEQRARSIEGVKRVINLLFVSPDAGPGPLPGAPAGRGQTDAIPQNPEEGSPE